MNAEETLNIRHVHVRHTTHSSERNHVHVYNAYDYRRTFSAISFTHIAEIIYIERPTENVVGLYIIWASMHAESNEDFQIQLIHRSSLVMNS